MNNVIAFPTPAPREQTEVNVEFAQELVGDLFKAHIATLLCSDELGIDDYDVELIEYLYLKYSEQLEEYMQ